MHSSLLPSLLALALLLPAHAAPPPFAVTNLAGLPGTAGKTDGTGNEARFHGPVGLAADRAGNLFVADLSNHVIRKVSPAGAVTTFAGAPAQDGFADGPAANARFNQPFFLAFDSAGSLYVSELGNHAIRKLTPAGVVSTFAGGDGQFNRPAGLAFDAADNLFVADTASHTIRLVTPRGLVVTLAGTPGVRGAADGPVESARFAFPTDLCVDPAGNLYVADSGNYTIRKVSATGTVSTLAGSPGQAGGTDGPGREARFLEPQGIRLTPDGSLLVGDSGNHTLRLVTPAGVVSTLAGLAGQAGTATGAGAAARFNRPVGFQMDGTNGVFITDALNHRITRGAPLPRLALPAPTPAQPKAR